jgi:hypothetical protein
MRWKMMPAICFSVFCLSLATENRAAADVDSYCVHSLEWLVDASQSVLMASVRREKDPGTDAWTVRVKLVERVLKAAGDAREPAAADLSAAVRAAGEHRVLLFLRPAAGKATPEVLYVVYLSEWTLPAEPAALAAALREAIPEGFDRPQMTNSDRCVAIDRTGRVLVDPDEVIRGVENRARQHPKRVTDAGFWAARGDALEDPNSVYFVRAPYDADERATFLKQLRSPDGLERAAAADHLGHYSDAEVVAALKACLRDDYFNSQTVADGQGGSRDANIYVVRRAAYESLRKLKQDVPKPELEHRR